ncbi:MAG: protein kinase [Planctomycetota bacterium]
MSNPNLDRFLKDLRDSGVVPEGSLQPLLARLQGEDPRGLALSLVQAGLLTDWQAKFILSGRSRLRVGNYLLEERSRRDELGDCFLAWHEPLHRRVQLQILPEKITRQSPEFAAVSNSVGTLTALDHPRVEQTYDLGEDGGRLFVVHEMSSGKLLDSPAKLNLTQGEAAGLVQGVSAGLAYLQSRSVGHGNLAGGALLLGEDGLGKIAGLCEATLRRAVGLEHASTSEELLSLDRRQWVEIAQRLLAKYFRTAEFAEWPRLLQESLAEPKKLELLAEQVAAWQRELKPTEETSELDFLSEASEQAETAIAPSPRPQAARHVDKPAAAAQKRVAKIEKETSSGGNRWLKLYSVALSALVLVGLASYLAWKFWPSGAGEAKQVAVASNQPPAELPKLAVPAEQTKPAEQPSLPNLPAAIEGSVEEKPKQPSPSEPLPPLGQTPPPAQEPSSSPKSGSDDKSTQKVNEPTAPPSSGNGGSKKDPFLIPGQTSKPTAQPESKPDSKPSTESQQKGNSQPAAPPASKPAPAGNPLDGFPKVAQLGEVGKGLQVLGPLPDIKFEDLTMRLRYDPETVARSKVFFELQPQSEQQAWKVSLKKREDATETEPVGEFKLADGQLQFAWATEVDARSLALALSNCLLQLESSQGGIATSILREPVLIEGFTLDPKSLTAESSFDLPGPPNEESVKFKLGPFLADSPWAEASVVNENFEAKQPAVVVFRSIESEQLFGLEFDRRLRAKVELSADWVVRAVGKPQKLKAVEFQRLVDEAGVAYSTMAAESDRATRAAEDAITGTKTRMRDQATKVKNAMLETKKQNELIQAHKSVIDGIASQEIPIRVTYQFEDREIILAENQAGRAAAAAPPPAEKPKSSDEIKEKNRRRED